MIARRPRLPALILAVLALLAQISIGSAATGAAKSGGIFAAAHICGTSLPGNTHDHPSDHDRTTCPSCPLCCAAAVQAVLPPAPSAPPVPSQGPTPHSPSHLHIALLPARLLGAAMPTGPPALT